MDATAGLPGIDAYIDRARCMIEMAERHLEAAVTREQWMAIDAACERAELALKVLERGDLHLGSYYLAQADRCWVAALRWSTEALVDLTRNAVEGQTKRAASLKEATTRWNRTKKTEAAARYADWQRKANEIWRCNSGLSPTRVAQIIAEKHGGNADYIRHKISKPPDVQKVGATG